MRNMFEGEPAPRPPVERWPDASRLTDSDEVRATRRVMVPTAPGADPDWVTEIELRGVRDAEELAALRAGELEDFERWGENPWEA